MSITRTIKGKLKKTEGQITGDKVREAQGAAEEKAGTMGTRVKAKVDQAKAKLSEKKAQFDAKRAKAKSGR